MLRDTPFAFPPLSRRVGLEVDDALPKGITIIVIIVGRNFEYILSMLCGNLIAARYDACPSSDPNMSAWGRVAASIQAGGCEIARVTSKQISNFELDGISLQEGLSPHSRAGCIRL